ncbi:DUF4336 domain-containing protein [Alloalcanivorax xenomutans]|uniref:DUF4336 domain-containing protein n=1 Tax=Alloalcanivorax xenomutans TaxID=1094342 RepID=UPI000BDB3A54|nr:DUF4336 domain-containing protein [Alloalcanivorax xenomutans]SOC07513.1 uncharacterized protein DUF4336 [Alloalcanivorax xenomutans]
MDTSREPGIYTPLNQLKPVADSVWVVDGPMIRFGPPGMKMPFPTRMTLVRSADGGLFVHSPTALTEPLRRQVLALGEPRWLIGPNRIHYWWLPRWQAAFPAARTFVAPGVRERAGERIDFPVEILDRGGPWPWDDLLRTLPVTSRYMTEVVFFHPHSRTLILTDLVENFEASRLAPAHRWLARLGGVLDPDGQMPRDMRLTFLGRRSALRDAVRTLLGWQPERVILAHGRWYREKGEEELRRAFRWLL